MNLSLALAYHSGAREQTIEWMKWVKELGGLGEHKLYTICAFDCQPVPDILPNIKVTDSEEITGDWQSDAPARSAAAPNSMLRIFAWKFYLEKLGPFLFVEPDAIPLKPGWIDTIEAEYIRGGKPFMGAHVLIDKVPPHLTGNMCLPENVPEVAPSLIMRTNWVSEGREYELAFDIAGAKEILPQAHYTNLIQHKFRHKGFRSMEEVNATIDPAAVIFHSCKDLSLIRLLRGETISCAEVTNREAVDGSPPVAPSAHGLNSEPTIKGLAFREFPEITATNELIETRIGDTRQSLIHDTVAVLKSLGTAPRYVGMVRKELRAQGVIR